MRVLLILLAGVNAAMLVLNGYRAVTEWDSARLAIAVVNLIGMVFCIWAWHLAIVNERRREEVQRELDEFVRHLRDGGS